MASRGRPRIGAEVRVRLTPDQRAACDQLAADRGVKLADVVRAAIVAYVDMVATENGDGE